MKKKFPVVEIKLDRIVGGGQTIGNMPDGRKIFVWGGLPGELVSVQITKQKSKMCEGIVTAVIEPSKSRISPQDTDSFLSTSPWQIMSFDDEQHYKASLIEEAFELHNIVLPDSIDVFSDNKIYGYRNKIEFSWWWNKSTEEIDLAFFRRGTHGKMPVYGTSLAIDDINRAAIDLRNILRDMPNIKASMLKTLLVRCDQLGKIVMQLYVNDSEFPNVSDSKLKTIANIKGFELIFSNPKSPASVITKRLQSCGETTLTDTLVGINFNYAVEGFFQINLPVYEQALIDMKRWVIDGKPTVDLYSGVGTIGLTIGGEKVTMVEINEHAVNEMKRNIKHLNKSEQAKAILAPSEQVLDSISGEATIIVDPPRAGLHEDVVNKLLESKPQRIIYLSCNPVTQARDVFRLSEKYGVKWHRGYNFFPRTPHIEHLVILDLK